ncbi:MAG: hypothetical protein ACW990_17545 [Promethearchaeota archaeon]
MKKSEIFISKNKYRTEDKNFGGIEMRKEQRRYVRTIHLSNDGLDTWYKLKAQRVNLSLLIDYLLIRFGKEANSKQIKNFKFSKRVMDHGQAD